MSARPYSARLYRGPGHGLSDGEYADVTVRAQRNLAQGGLSPNLSRTFATERAAKRWGETVFCAANPSIGTRHPVEVTRYDGSNSWHPIRSSGVYDPAIGGWLQRETYARRVAADGGGA